MKKMKQTLNAGFKRDSEFDIECWTLGVGHFPPRLP